LTDKYKSTKSKIKLSTNWRHNFSYNWC